MLQQALCRKSTQGNEGNLDFLSQSLKELCAMRSGCPRVNKELPVWVAEKCSRYGGEEARRNLEHDMQVDNTTAA